MLFHKVGLASASNGFGKVLEFILLFAFWFLVFGQKHLVNLIHKVVPEKVSTNAMVESEPVEVQTEKPNKSYIPKSVDIQQQTEETPTEEPTEKAEGPTHE